MSHARWYTSRKAAPRTWITCEACGKRGYDSRAKAKAVLRSLHDDNLHVYPCRAQTTGAQVFHIGHQSPTKTREHYDRKQMRGTP